MRGRLAPEAVVPAGTGTTSGDIDGYEDSSNGSGNSNPVVFQTLLGDENGDVVFCGLAGPYDPGDLV